jgi:thiol-disulfide isomerase/thioredoxin
MFTSERWPWPRRSPVFGLARGLLGILLALLVACGAAATPVPTATNLPTGVTPPITASTPENTATPLPTATQKGPTFPPAAEIEGIHQWLNSEPLTIAQQRGQVVLVDFWTYTCVNCIRTFPFLKQWHDQYADDGLVILGIHTPEFEFERDPENVAQAVQDYGIAWPVALDNDYVTWDNYFNQFWPAKYLIDGQGLVRHQRFGEGGYPATEEKIRALLVEAGADLSDDPFTTQRDHQVDPRFLGNPENSITPELYAGYQRGTTALEYAGQGYIGQNEYYYTPDEETLFKEPSSLGLDLIYFQGLWRSEAERARHARQTENYEDHLALVYSARSVNAVLTSDSGEPYRVRVTLDGAFLTEENKGADVIIDTTGESYLPVTSPRMYRVVEHPTYYAKQTLRMSSNSPDFGIFAFTFGVYREGP